MTRSHLQQNSEDHDATGTSAAGRPRAALSGGGAILRRSSAAPILLGTAALFLVSWLIEPSSVRGSALLGMLPFAALLAIAGMGQTLVVQQGGIDLSVPGMISLTVTIMTAYPNGDSSKVVVAALLAFAATLSAGLLSGLIVSRVGVTPIVVTLGMNALLYGAVVQISNDVLPDTTNGLANFASSRSLGVPNTVIIAVVITALLAFGVKKTIFGRRFEAVGAGLFASRAAGLGTRRYQVLAYVAAAGLYCTAGILLAGLVTSPSVFQGDDYLLPSVAAVVLGGTSLLGGRGSVVATAVAALFITQLGQFVLETGAGQGVQNIDDAVALAAGLAIYSVPWRRLAQAVREARSHRGGSSGSRIDADPVSG
jgi:ribose transport system permease protein